MATAARFRPLHQHLRRHLSSAAAILNASNSTGPLTARQKSRAALSLLKSEKDPDKILQICRAADLTPDIHLDRLAFSAAVSSLASSSSFISIRSLLSDLPASRPDLQNDRFRSHAIVLFGQAGMLDDAIRLFAQAPTTKSLNSLLFACVLAKKHDEVGRIFKEYPKSYGVVPDADTYNAVVRAFCESGTARSAYSVVEEMGKKGVKPTLTTYNTMISGFYKEEKYADVDKVLEMMNKSGCSPAVSTYNTMIQGLCKLKKPGEAKALLEKMVHTKGVKPNKVTYQSLIHGFCKEGNLEEVKMLFAEMGKRGCAPDSDCYFTVVHYLCQGGDFEEALKVCKQSMEKNWVPCFSTMKALVKGLVGASKVDDAREIAGAVKEKFSVNAEQWKEVEESLLQ